MPTLEILLAMRPIAGYLPVQTEKMMENVSLLSLSALERLAMSACLLALLWLIVVWAI